jgi:hypothetical protein
MKKFRFEAEGKGGGKRCQSEDGDVEAVVEISTDEHG